jgi:hypothetical protein
VFVVVAGAVGGSLVFSLNDTVGVSLNDTPGFGCSLGNTLGVGLVVELGNSLNGTL